MKHKYLLLSVLCFFFHSIHAQYLLEVTDLGIKTKAELVESFGLLAQYEAQAYKIIYATTDAKGQATQASGLITIPILEGFAFPLICYQHGTVWQKEQIPSNLSEEADVAWLLASNGYVAVLPDYLGFGESPGIHPYLHADTEASVAVDMLFAARELAEEKKVALNDQLFVTGYSQGGHAAAALHRSLQNNYSNEFTVVASAPMSGPYDISGVNRNVILSDDPYFFPAFLVNAFISYNYVYDLYPDLSAIFVSPYDELVKKFAADSIGMTFMNEQMIDQLIEDHEQVIVKKMLQDSIVDILTEANPEHPLIQTLLNNDVHSWIPQVTTRFFYCLGDDRVSPNNSLVIASTMQANGAPDVMAVNMDSSANHIECIPSAILNGLFFFAPFKQLVTNTEQEEITFPIKIFPNPAQDHIQLEGVPPGAFIQLIHMNGQVLNTQIAESESSVINLHSIQPGIILLRIVCGQTVITKKVIKQ